MTASLPTGPFAFETSYDTAVVRPEYSSRRRESKLGLTEEQLFLVFTAIGVLCLLWRYTVSLGVGVLLMAALLWSIRARSLRNVAYLKRLREPSAVVTIRVSDTGYSIRGDDFAAETSWNRVINGFEMGDYLLVQSWQMPRLYLPIDKLRAAGVYDRVRDIVEAKNAERKALAAEARAAR